MPTRAVLRKAYAIERVSSGLSSNAGQFGAGCPNRHAETDARLPDHRVAQQTLINP
jgi:hypothetical protein